MMKANKTGSCDANLATGVKAASILLIGLVGLALAAAALPIILPLLWMLVVVGSGIGVIVGAVWLLGFIVNLFKRNK
jgi:hypothetical protein